MALDITKIGLCCALLIASTQLCFAAERNDIKSCYDYARVDPKTASSVPQRHLFVAIDGTFSPDINIKKLVHQKVHLFLQPGDKVTIINFSAYVEDFYTNILFTGKLDTDIANRDDVSKKLLRKFDHCMSQQGAYVKRRVDSSIISSFKKDDVNVPKTEILSNLSQVIAPIIAADNDGRRLLLLVSDMVENSDVTSFYASNSLKTIAPEQEIAKVTKANMLSNFNQADIYVLGAGWITSDTKGYRGGDKMLPLKQFWSQYFDQSNAKLKAFGQPVLMVDM
ncbi:hypothetical protein [Shewanella phaeophyticola]|uniref:VWFA domain-containing protein n=1 Tax=Shewanella phaeophyticola TaxID=2978345 RepID=A0ABT2NZI0_9GAMM|nr:hypothetical protein [Shewanella sp. KJ10-1]MCT8985799.1 hypothetical protein [Shewanella sp. KJ10-1]